MKYLVDANVLSEPTKPTPDAGVLEWLQTHLSECVVDPVILGELRIGILQLPNGRKRAGLEAWFESITDRVECLPWDASISRCWAELVAELRKRGETMPILDSMIAATALRHGLIIVSRNVRDFRKAGVKVVDPFG